MGDSGDSQFKERTKPLSPSTSNDSTGMQVEGVKEKQSRQEIGFLAKECQLGKALANINFIIDQALNDIPSKT